MSLERKLIALQQTEITAWEQPKIFQLQNGKNDELEELLDQDQISRVKNLSDSTIDELARMRFPVRMHSEDVRAEYRKDLIEQGVDYGGYAAFDDRDGRKHLVHYPPEQDHTELLHWRHNGRLTPEHRQKIYKDVTGFLFGLSVGNSIAQGLVRAGAMDTAYIGDTDTISLSNLGRLAYHPEDVDRLKTVATADSLTRINPYIKINILPNGYDVATDELLEQVRPSFIVEEVDSPTAKAGIERAAIENKIPVFTVADIQNAVLEVRRHDKEVLQPFGGRLSLEQYNSLLSGTANQVEQLKAMVGIVGEENVLSDTELIEALSDPASGGFPQLFEIVSAGAALSTSAIVAYLKGREVKTGTYTYDPGAILEIGHPYDPQYRQLVADNFSKTIGIA